MKYSYFASVRSKHCRQLSVAELLETLKAEPLRKLCDDIVAAVLTGDMEKANQLKSQLPVIVVNELYDQNAPRKKGTGKPTGIVMIDYDNCETIGQLEAMETKLKKLSISHPVLKDCIVAAHESPRRHGVHVWYRWLDGCHDIKECHAKFAYMAEMPGYDEGCNDSSRCSYLVDASRFFINNFGAMDRNEQYAELQTRLTNERNIRQHESNPAGRTLPLADDSGRCLTGGDDVAAVENRQEVSYPTTFEGVEYDRIFKELTVKCCPASRIDNSGNVLEGARDNTLFKVVCLFRYICDNKPEWVAQYLPEWARGLDNDKQGRCMELITSACARPMSFSTPRTLATVLNTLKTGDAESLTEQDLQEKAVAELQAIDANKRKFFALPAVLPPVFQEFAQAFPFAWKPAAILALLPMLGTIMSRIRGVYLDKRVHSPSFQTVIEAKFGRGKGNITDMARMVLEPLVLADAVGNAKLNNYNALVEKSNGTEKLPDKPDVCVRKITGDFTVAGFEETLNTSKGLHMWCGTSEIDEVRKIWQAVSHILRKAYDNDLYGRSLQSTKSFRGERPIYFNTLLCGTSRAVRRCYVDPEDGLVSRTLFFKLMRDDEQMPVVKMSASTRNRLSVFLKKLHDTYSLDAEGHPVLEQHFKLDFVNKSLQQWLREQYNESVLTGNESRDSFRRRDAVNGFRAALVAVAIYAAMGRKIGDKEKAIIKDFARWVASYSLEMHLLKYGDDLNKMSVDDDFINNSNTNILSQLPDRFTLREAYKTFSGRAESSVRSMLSRLVASGYLTSEERGFYSKK